LAITLSAQVGAAQTAGEKDSKGRIFTKVIVTMAEPSSFGRPVAGLTFLVVTENGDRISVTTDDAGVAGAWLSPASYRFVTPDPVEWQGKNYTWDSILPVKAEAPIIKFSQENASKVISVAPTAAPAVQPVQAGYRPPTVNTSPSNSTVPFQFKDGTTATLLSVLITGGGQMYSGEVGKGVVMLIAGVGAVVIGYSASGCDQYGCNDTGPLVTGYAVAFGIWLGGVIDAHNAAARHNAKAPRAMSFKTMTPVISQGAQGTTRVGVDLRF
jgi:hypothetical protein